MNPTEKLKRIDELLAALDAEDETILSAEAAKHGSPVALAAALKISQESRDPLHRIRGQVVKAIEETRVRSAVMTWPEQLAKWNAELEERLGVKVTTAKHPHEAVLAEFGGRVNHPSDNDTLDAMVRNLVITPRYRGCEVEVFGVAFVVDHQYVEVLSGNPEEIANLRASLQLVKSELKRTTSLTFEQVAKALAKHLHVSDPMPPLRERLWSVAGHIVREVGEVRA